MNQVSQVLLTALQASCNEKNIVLLVPYMTSEDDIICVLDQMKKLAEDSKANRAAAQEAAPAPETAS
jgi:hypothetical protein